MDLIRSTIKSLFYDFPLHQVGEFFDARYSPQRFYLLLKEILNRREKSFTSSELEMVCNVMEDEWLKDNGSPHLSDSAWSKHHPFEKIFYLVSNCSALLLNISRNRPSVKFEQLLRWRDLSLFTGEDTLILPSLAYFDVNARFGRTDFLWENILAHDNSSLNSIFDKGLFETHCHLNAATDVSEINWICMMNNPNSIFPDKISSRTLEFLTNGSRQEYDSVERFARASYNLRDWTKVAALIRFELFRHYRYGHSFGAFRLRMNDDLWIRNESRNLENQISVSKSKVLRATDANVIDYALVSARQSCHGIDECNGILAGDRILLYKFLRDYFGGKGEAIRFAPYVYLYMLIKNKVRREFIQTNDLKGFRNFEDYQNRKTSFISASMETVALKYAVHSSLQHDHHLEARITPGSIKKVQQTDFSLGILSKGILYPDCKDQFSIVVHFIKKKMEINAGLSIRHENLRKKLKHEIETVIKAHESKPNKNPRVVGIDVAGNELYARPEVFAPSYRYAKLRGITNRTFHAGEDYYDIIDGLRTIDELIKFCEFRNGDRIGHGLALGEECVRYYETRHNTVVLPKQVLLDNLVWFKYSALENNINISPETLHYIDNRTGYLYHDLGYRAVFNSQDYWHAMNMRGDDPLHSNNLSMWSICKKSDISKTLLPNKNADNILIDYQSDKNIMERGNKTITEKFPNSYAKDVAMIQTKMLEKVEDLNLVIECNPSSNLKIGRFHRYEEHPIFRFQRVTPHAEGNDIKVTINTDDKGIFYTSISNEYSLIAAAMAKMKDSEGNRKWTNLEIENYISRIADFARQSSFK